jgi:hypothetical protein
MSDNYTESTDYGTDGFDQQEQGDQQGRNPLREQIARQEKQLREANSKAEAGAQALRTLEIAKAGVDIVSPTGQMFAEWYKGDLSPDAIKAAAQERGVITPPAPTAQQTAQDQADRAVFQQGPADMAGGTADGARDWDAEIASAKDEAEVIRLYRERHGQDSVKDD